MDANLCEGLFIIYNRDICVGHCHAGNVVVADGVARLLDIENFILGVPSFYRPFFMQHSKIHTAEMIDVYSFGHLMYELSIGYSLQESVTRQPIDCSESLSKVFVLRQRCRLAHTFMCVNVITFFVFVFAAEQLLESILSKEACKVGLPTLDQLAEHRFFVEHAPRFAEQYAGAVSKQATKPHFKLSSVAKEQLKIAVQRTEQRLRDEQKSVSFFWRPVVALIVIVGLYVFQVKNQKRLVRVQELMSSEEEKKKIKQKAVS